MSEWQEKIKANCEMGHEELDPGMEDDLGMIFDRLDRDVWMFCKDTRPIQKHKSMYEDGYLKLQHMPTRLHLWRKRGNNMIYWQINCAIEENSA